jgi:hypothetical protein
LLGNVGPDKPGVFRAVSGRLSAYFDLLPGAETDIKIAVVLK